MELRTVNEMLLRPKSLPLVSFLSTSARNSHQPQTIPSRAARSFVCQSCRKFSIILPCRQQAAARKTPLETWEDVSDKPKRQSSLDSEDQKVLDDALDFSRTPGASAKHKQRFKSLNAQAGQGLKYSSEQLGGSSLGDTERAFNAPSLYNPRSLVRNTTQSPSSVMFPEPKKSNLGGFANIDSASKQLVSRPRVLKELNIHLSARTGRTLKVENKLPMDLGTKMRQLEMLVSRNKIRRDFNQQKFHERGGLKRKRLASQRWRKNFKDGFVRAVTRVQDLRRKGW